MFEKVFEYAGKNKKKIYFSTVIMFLSVLSGIIPFFFVYQIIEELITVGSVEVNIVVKNIVFIFISLVVQAVLGGFSLNLSHKAAYGTLYNLQVFLQKKIEKLPLGVIEAKGVGSIKKLFVDDIDGLEVLLAHGVPEGIANLMAPVIVYIYIFYVDWKLGILSLASIPISIFAMKRMYKIGMNLMQSYYMSGQKMNNTIIEYINGMEVIKVFNRSSESFSKFVEDVKGYRDYSLNWYKVSWPLMAVYNVLLPCTLILTLPLGTLMVIKGYSTLPELILCLCLALSIGIPLLKALAFMPTLPQINYKIKALESMITETPLKEGNKNLNGDRLDIDFKDVCFGYDDKEVLNNINLQIKQGEKCAFVGESGSGKSTLVKLITHYYDINSGSISIGDTDIKDVSLSELNSYISYVSQEQYLFNDTIKNNILIGNPSASDDEVKMAANMSECMEFIDRMPEGFNTLVGEGGSALSGGQRQRIALARAIIKDSPIIILDEATASIDPENEDQVENAIKEISKNKTLIVIAHKLKYIIDSDKIVVMNSGKIESIGIHDNLVSDSKTYKRLWSAYEYGLNWKPDVKEG